MTPLGSDLCFIPLERNPTRARSAAYFSYSPSWAWNWLFSLLSFPSSEKRRNSSCKAASRSRSRVSSEWAVLLPIAPQGSRVPGDRVFGTRSRAQIRLPEMEADRQTTSLQPPPCCSGAPEPGRASVKFHQTLHCWSVSLVTASEVPHTRSNHGSRRFLALKL